MKQLLSLLILTATLSVSAKDYKTVTVTTQPQMHCENCEKKIKGNLRFEKGVKQIATDRDQQRVTITYDADKTTADLLIQSFGKFGYKATAVKEPEKEKKEEKQ